MEELIDTLVCTFVVALGPLVIVLFKKREEVLAYREDEQTSKILHWEKSVGQFNQWGGHMGEREGRTIRMHKFKDNFMVAQEDLKELSSKEKKQVTIRHGGLKW